MTSTTTSNTTSPLRLVAGQSPGTLAHALARQLPVRADSPLFRRDAVLVLDDGGEPHTLRLHGGWLTAQPGRARHPDALLAADTETLCRLVLGEESAAEGFLDGRLRLRGDVALALAVDALFPRDTLRPPRWPHAGLVVAAGMRTAYLDAGPPAAPRVVLLHGLGATNASMLPLVWDLARDHRVIAPDLPGFGASAAPHGRYDFAWFSRWLAAFVEELGLGPVVLAGNSMGGRIALEAGLDSPEHVRGLVLLAPSPAFRRLRQWVPMVRLLRPELAALPMRTWRPLVVEGMRAMFSDPDRLPPSWFLAAADEFERSFAHPASRVAFFACARQIYLEDAFGARGFWQRLSSLRPPALFLWGDRDRLVPASFARHVAQALPDAGSIVLEDCGHVPQFEHPALVAEIVRAFLADVDARR